MARTALVPALSLDVNLETDLFETRYQFTNFLQQRTSSAMAKSYPGCQQIIRTRFDRRQTPNNTIEIMMASLTESSLKQYDSALKKWWCFCSKNSIDSFTNSIHDILAGLIDAFENGASYGTLNCLRSAISLIVGHEIGRDPDIRRFFKGVFNKRPCKPRYDYTWDPKTVLNYLSSQTNNESTTLKALSTKLISLFALVTGHRLQTFALIDVRNIRKTTTTTTRTHRNKSPREDKNFRTKQKTTLLNTAFSCRK